LPGAVPFSFDPMVFRSFLGLALLCSMLAGSPVLAQDLPPQLADHFAEGVDALKTHDLDRAERAFRTVLAGGGNRAFVHHNLGIVLQQRGRQSDALAEFRAATALDPAFGPAHLLAGTCLLALGRTSDAVASLQRAVRLMPSEVSAHLQLAAAYEQAGNTVGMVDEYRRLASLEPGNNEWVFRLGKAYLKLAQWSYERLATVRPQSARLAQALAQQYLDQGRSDLATGALEEAARRNPTLPEIHLTLARIHADEGRWNDASRELALELAIVPESAAARDLKAAIDAARTRP
jgi:predicted Zn-dependent protease